LFSYTERNHFDRFVHLGFGFLIFPYLFQIVSKWGISSIFKTLLVTWLMLQSMSLIYELLEWNLTLMASPEDAETYNGQQGDRWDAQKDMALAMLGSTLIGLIYLLSNFRKKQIHYP
jgi:putative membrane protein